jgi:dihydrodipicolinate synthase/N-acetylneuraminate lyase
MQSPSPHRQRTPIDTGSIRETLRRGKAIVAHPLSLDAQRRFDPVHQQVLTRYYHAAGVGGVAVGVHTTQFAIHDSSCGLLQPVLEIAANLLSDLDRQTGRQTVRIAGICGATSQAVTEAQIARELGYHAGLLSLRAFRDASEQEMLAHAKAVACELPVFGFYLQPAAGGRPLSLAFWRQFVEIPNVVAIKIAPFNRYQTLDVLRAVAESGRVHDIALYTGNDDHIVLDLLTGLNGPSERADLGNPIPKLSQLRMVGGLLGHWACWTKPAMEVFEEIQHLHESPCPTVRPSLLKTAIDITDANSALFDAANHFSGCIAGIQEVLFRQGLVRAPYCLNPNEVLSPGQSAELDRVTRDYPYLTDDTFVREHLADWVRQSS